MLKNSSKELSKVDDIYILTYYLLHYLHSEQSAFAPVESRHFGYLWIFFYSVFKEMTASFTYSLK